MGTMDSMFQLQQQQQQMELLNQQQQRQQQELMAAELLRQQSEAQRTNETLMEMAADQQAHQHGVETQLQAAGTPHSFAGSLAALAQAVGLSIHGKTEPEAQATDMSKAFAAAEKLSKAEAPDEKTLLHGVISDIPAEQLARELRGTRLALANELKKDHARMAQIALEPDNVAGYAAKLPDAVDDHTHLILKGTAKKLGMAQDVSGVQDSIPVPQDKEQLKLELIGTINALAKQLAQNPGKVAEIQQDSGVPVSYITQTQDRRAQNAEVAAIHGPR